MLIQLLLLTLLLGPPNCPGVEPNDSQYIANGIWGNTIIPESLSYLDEADWFRLDDVVENVAYDMTVIPITPRTDTYVMLVDRDGKLLTGCDDYDFNACSAGDIQACGCTVRFSTTSLPIFMLVIDWQVRADYACHNYLLEYVPAPVLSKRVYLPMLSKSSTCPGCTPTGK